MKKLILLLFLSVSTLLAFAQNEFTISGTLPDDKFDGEMIFLKQPDDEKGFISIDSVYVKNNTFTLKGKAGDSPSPAFVFFKQRQPGIPMASMVIIEGGNIRMDIASTSSVGGTRFNDDFQRFMEEQNRIIGGIRSANDSETSEKLKGELKVSTYNYLNKNMTNGIGEFFIEDAAKLIDAYQVVELIRKSRPDFQESPKAKFLVTELLSQQPSVGDSYIDIQLMDTDGKAHALSEYIGKNKYVLLDFWASWCNPCMKEAPNLVEAYKKYKDKGFEIVGISLDENQLQWEQTIKRMNMNWVQLSDLRGWRSAAARLYKANSIPLTLLVDSNGKVVAKNLRGDDLSKKLKELLD